MPVMPTLVVGRVGAAVSPPARRPDPATSMLAMVGTTGTTRRCGAGAVADWSCNHIGVVITLGLQLGCSGVVVLGLPSSIGRVPGPTLGVWVRVPRQSFCWCSSMAELRFCKSAVVGSTPTASFSAVAGGGRSFVLRGLPSLEHPTGGSPVGGWLKSIPADFGRTETHRPKGRRNGGLFLTELGGGFCLRRRRLSGSVATAALRGDDRKPLRKYQLLKMQ